MDYQLTHTTSSGEVYAVSHRFNSMWEFMGYNVYKNDNFLTFISDGSEGVDNDNKAIEIGMRREIEEHAAEKAFNKSHPELTP